MLNKIVSIVCTKKKFFIADLISIENYCTTELRDRSDFVFHLGVMSKIMKPKCDKMFKKREK